MTGLRTTGPYGIYFFDIVDVTTEQFEHRGYTRGIANLNPLIFEAVRRSAVKWGEVRVQSLHSTAGILVQEDEDGILRHDIPDVLDAIVPIGTKLLHDDFDRRRVDKNTERVNGKSHLEFSLVLRISETIMVNDYKPLLGDWLSVLLYDADPVGRASRRVAIKVVGERDLEKAP